MNFSNWLRLLFTVMATAGVAALTGAPAAFAHEYRLVGPNSEYSVVFGWIHEPAFTGEVNGVEIYISRSADDKAVNTSEGDVVDLTVEIQRRAEDKFEAATLDSLTIGEKPSLAMHAKNRYITWVRPTRAGAYAFRVTGTISDASDAKAGAVKIDETFVCGGGRKDDRGYVCVKELPAFPASW